MCVYTKEDFDEGKKKLKEELRERDRTLLRDTETKNKNSGRKLCGGTYNKSLIVFKDFYKISTRGKR